MKATFALLVNFIGVFATGQALKCYVCNSEYDGDGCKANPPSPKFLVECTPETAKPINNGATSDKPFTPSEEPYSSTTPTTTSSTISPQETSSRKPISPHEILAIPAASHNNDSSASMGDKTTTQTDSGTTQSPPVTPTTRGPSGTGVTRNLRQAENTSSPVTNQTGGIELVMATAVVNYTMCRKDDVTVPDQHNGEHFVQKGKRIIYRSCGWLGKTEKVCRTLPSESLTFLQCSCVDDSCNSSNTTSIPQALLAVLLFILTATGL